MRQRREPDIDTAVCYECGMIICKYPVTQKGKEDKNVKLARHKELYHSGFYLRDSKGNFVKNEKDLAAKEKFRCPFCSKVIGPQELIDNVGNRFIQVPKGNLKGKPAHRQCFDLAASLGEVEDFEEKLDEDETYEI